MANIATYNINNHSVSEQYKPTDPNEQRELKRRFSERLLERMKLKVVER